MNHFVVLLCDIPIVREGADALNGTGEQFDQDLLVGEELQVGCDHDLGVSKEDTFDALLGMDEATALEGAGPVGQQVFGEEGAGDGGGLRIERVQHFLLEREEGVGGNGREVFVVVGDVGEKGGEEQEQSAWVVILEIGIAAEDEGFFCGEDLISAIDGRHHLVGVGA